MTRKPGRHRSRGGAPQRAATRSLMLVVAGVFVLAGAVAGSGVLLYGRDGGMASLPGGSSTSSTADAPMSTTQVSVPDLRQVGSSSSVRTLSARPTPDASRSVAIPTLTPTVTPTPTPTRVRPSSSSGLIPRSSTKPPRPTTANNTSTAPVGSGSARSDTPVTAPTTAVAAQSITLAFTGDVLVHTGVIEQAATDAGDGGYSFRKMFAAIAPAVRSADWAICHQETVIGAPEDAALPYPLFRAPYAMATDMKDAGWDACDTASNHTTDHGQTGVDSTLQALDDAHLAHTGSYRDEASFSKDTVYRIKGVRVGHIAATYGLNEANPNSWSVNIVDVADIAARARVLKKGGADIVVVSLHAGIEQQQQPSDDQLAWSAAIMASPDVDLFVGAHAHVVQPIRRLEDGRYIVYGLGNLLALQSTVNPRNLDGVIVMPTFTRATDGRYRVSRMGYVATATIEAGGTTRVELAPPEVRQQVQQILASDGAAPTDLTDTYR